MVKLIFKLHFALLLSSTMSYADRATHTPEEQVCVTSPLSDKQSGIAQPGLRNYVEEKGLTIYEGSYIRNILGITDELNLNPIAVKTNFDEFIRQRITGDQSTALSPESIATFINKNSGLLTVTFDDKQNRFEVDERIRKQVNGHAYCSAPHLPSAIPITDKITKGVVADKIGTSGAFNSSISNNAQSTAYSIRSKEQFSDVNEEALFTSIKSAPILQDGIFQPLRGTGFKSQDWPEKKLISFTTHKDETLANVIERFSSKSGIEVTQDSLGFKLSNVLMTENTYTAESYIEILKFILSGKNILISVGDSE